MHRNRLDERLKATSDHTVDDALARLSIADCCVGLAKLGCMRKNPMQWEQWLNEKMERIGSTLDPKLYPKFSVNTQAVQNDRSYHVGRAADIPLSAWLHLSIPDGRSQGRSARRARSP